jgi:hypothetical protein
LFPDFHTFSSMGFSISNISVMDNALLDAIPMGKSIESIPVFRSEDFMYHTQCEDPDRMVRVLFIFSSFVLVFLA